MHLMHNVHQLQYMYGVYGNKLLLRAQSVYSNTFLKVISGSAACVAVCVVCGLCGRAALTRRTRRGGGRHTGRGLFLVLSVFN